MSGAEFDQHARGYRQQHRDNIALTGEEPEYFARYKMRDFAALVADGGLPATGRYLDFGSGIGAAVAPFRTALSQARLVCADVSASSLALSRQAHGSDVEHVLIGEGRLPFEDASFDGGYACCVFHHIAHDRHEGVLTELRRVVRPGGVLMVYEHNPFNPLTVRAVRTCPFDENAVLLSASRLRRRAAAAGWKVWRTDYRVFFPAALSGLRTLETGLRWLPLGAQYFVALQA